MTRAAEIGPARLVGRPVQERMAELTDKLESRAATGATASYSGNAIDATPSPLPDANRVAPS